MRLTRTSHVVLVVMLMLTFGVVASAKDTATGKAREAELLAATYAVPDLTDDLAKDLIKSLSKVKGMVSAKPDVEAGSFVVTFKTGLTSHEKVQKAMREVAPETEFEKVGPAAHEHTADCGKCPRRHTCSGQKKDH